MKLVNSSIFLLLLFLLGSCSVIGGIFKAGVWTGIILIVLVVGFLIYLFGRRSNS
jgi:Flp pilus assembly protein protease CpaA